MKMKRKIINYVTEVKIVDFILPQDIKSFPHMYGKSFNIVEMFKNFKNHSGN